MWKALLCAAVGLLLGGCFGDMVRNAAHARDEELVRRASFDLSCPAESVHVTCLNENKDAREGYGVSACLTAGVEACGHRATYVLSGNGQWVMNNSDGNVH
jgi:hypothetical protein